jgi:[acyl-carrier-protein] S-malonyltransferase
MLEESGVPCDIVAGHSLGELSALAFAGVFDFETGLDLVCLRGRLMAEAASNTPGAMVAVLGMDADTIADMLTLVEGVWIANDNAPGQTVLSGTHSGIEHATRALNEAGARKIVPLSVAGAFHSPIMSAAADAFARVLDPLVFNNARVPVVQNTDPTPASEGRVIKTRLVSQIVSPVRWTETMIALGEGGTTLLIECGPGAVLTGLARRVDGLTAVACETSSVDVIREVHSS